jgi:uncharacterized membrane protein
MHHIFNGLADVIKTVYILIIPGASITYALFKEKNVSLIERVATGFTFSVLSVPLIAFYAHLLGMKINQLSITIEVACIILVSLLIAAIRHHERK